MRLPILFSAILLGASLAGAGSYSVTMTTAEDATAEFWATRLSSTPIAVVQQACNNGLKPLADSRAQIEADALIQAMKVAPTKDQDEVRCKLGISNKGCP